MTLLPWNFKIIRSHMGYIRVKSGNNIFNRFSIQKIYGKEVLHDFLRFLVQKTRQLLISVEEQDGVEKTRWRPKKPANRPHGTIFRNGNIKIRILEPLRVTKV